VTHVGAEAKPSALGLVPAILLKCFFLKESFNKIANFDIV
jgi:hypothetical protein